MKLAKVVAANKPRFVQTETPNIRIEAKIYQRCLPFACHEIRNLANVVDPHDFIEQDKYGAVEYDKE